LVKFANFYKLILRPKSHELSVMVPAMAVSDYVSFLHATV